MIFKFLYHPTLQTCKVVKALQVCFMLLLSTYALHAQYPTQYPNQQGGTGRSGYPNGSNPSEVQDTVPQDEVELDTANVQYFYADNLGKFQPENDSLLGNYFHQYDPARKRQLDYFNLGHTASAAYPSLYQPFLRRGLDIGLHAFDIHHIKNSDIRFYQQTKAFSDVFASVSSQSNSLINIRFARNFAHNLNFSLQFGMNSNINQRNEEGSVFTRTLSDGTGQNWIYSSFPRGRNTQFGLGLWKHSDKYDGFLTATWNDNSQLDGGGITDDSIFRQKSLAQALPVLINQAFTRYTKAEVSYLQYYKLNRNDSTGTKRNYLATHQITYKSALYKSSDAFSNAEPTNSESAFYKDFLNDERGVRLYLKDNQIENSFNISTTRARVSKDSVKTTVGGQNDWLEVGIAHSFHRINWESTTRNINNVIAKGRWNFTPNDNIKVETYAHFNLLGYNLGDYRLNGELSYTLKDIGSITAKAVNQLYEPTLVQSQLYLTQRPVWNNDFKKTLETTLSGTLAIPKAHFEGSVAYTLLNNYIYFDKNYKAQQGSTPLSIVQFIVTENLKLGAFHLDNIIVFQKSTEKFLRIPDIYSKNSLYAEGRIFRKAMLARLGFDFRYNTDWFAPSYMPLIGQFYVQETGTVKAYPALDAYFSCKVQSLRFFVKWENAVGSFSKNIYYQIFNYPIPDRQIRLGFRWQLLN